IGYYSDGFDFPYVKERAKINKVRLELGYNLAEIDNKYEQASMYGVSHIDILKFIRRTMSTSLKTNSFKLDEVANELLGEKKVDIDINDLPKAWDNDNNKKLNEFIKYNLQDTKLTYDLFFKIYSNLLEMVNITGLIPGDVCRMGYSQFVEWHIIRQSRVQNEVVLRKPRHHELEQRMSTRIKGAFVFEPEAGIYDDIIVFDFRSLYPSIITSHNLSLGAYHKEPRSSVNVNPEDEDMWFSEKPGFLSGILKEIIKLRTKYKKELKKDSKNLFLKAKVEALKILANSFYGYTIFYGSRWYSLESGETTTSFSRHYIQDVIAKAEKSGFKVIYSDTDSIFLILKGKTQKDAHDFVDKINSKLPEMMELEYEEHYPKGLFVSMKEGKGGAKKRYALCREDGSLKITGFESVRGNTSPIAKEVQEKILDLILHKKEEKEAFDYVKKIIQDLKDKKVENDKLIIITRISKPINQYDSIGPQVVVAKKMMKQGIHIRAGSRVKYIIKEGSGIIRDKAELPEELKQGDYDANYYIENQVIPAVERILELCGYDKDQLLGKGKQTGLGNFF
ncbi:DNA-directed DNA polymerase, partial [Candidatus Woesearchaeota archaeon]|nr:DNA-directed DNA polymerase [Candidatus Woesearchaeota archaeon]